MAPLLRIGMKMNPLLRCNKCGRKFHTEEELIILPDGHEYYKACPDCKTDAYLMDLEKE